MIIQHCRAHGRRLVRRSVATALMVVAGLVPAPEPSRAQEFTMKFATQTINDMQHEFIKVYKTELEKATNNRIKVEVYPASQLGGAQRQTEGLRLGTIEGAIGPVELFVGADQRFQVPALAGLYKNRDHLRRVVDVPEFRKAIFDVAAARGTVGLSLLGYDMQSFAFKAPVAKVADFSPLFATGVLGRGISWTLFTLLQYLSWSLMSLDQPASS